jgi:small subunit ribosomal protein S3
MGQKVHPYGFRLGIIRDWQSRWFADKEYREFVIEDDKIRNFLRLRLPGLHNAAASGRRGSGGGGGRTGGGGRSGRNMDAGVSQIIIERMANMVKVTLHTARPGLIIGRGGRGIDDLRVELEKVIPRKVQINVLEIKQPELDAYLVAESVAGQIERRVSFKRAIRLAIARTMQRGGKGIKVIVGGRLGGAEIARSYGDKDGKIPLHTLRADIDYGAIEARTQYGNIGVKVWIYRGEVLPGPVASSTALPRASAARPMPATPPVAPVESAEKKAKGWRRVARESAPDAADEHEIGATEPIVQTEEAMNVPVNDTIVETPTSSAGSQPETSTESTEPGETA